MHALFKLSQKPGQQIEIYSGIFYEKLVEPPPTLGPRFGDRDTSLPIPLAASSKKGRWGKVFLHNRLLNNV